MDRRQQKIEILKFNPQEYPVGTEFLIQEFSILYLFIHASSFLFGFLFRAYLLCVVGFSFYFLPGTFITLVSTNESYRPAASYQPSERSDFSFDNLSTTTDNNAQSKQPQSLPPPQQQSQSSRNVQRSVSQPECANEKSLFK